MKAVFLYIFSSLYLFSQVQYNHPKLDWQTIETDNFRIHFYSGTEFSARKGAVIAEKVYHHIVNLYKFKPLNKTDIVFTDVDDISNGAAYYYDNKIIIWTNPLDFELRGSHRWLQNVITHEFAHIVSMQKAHKFGKSIPAGYFQWIGYEKEKRPDVLYGYPNTLVSYPIPGTSVPPWLAEGSAQYMYPGADWDNWDSIRDMILRDRSLNNEIQSWVEINTFGKSGIGNESVYNTGFAFTRYLSVKYGSEVLSKIFVSISKPFNFSINKAIKDATGKNGNNVYDEFISVLKVRYKTLTSSIIPNQVKGSIIVESGTSNLFPTWNDDGSIFAFLSNKENDYFSGTDLFLYIMKSKKSKKLVDGVYSKPAWNKKSIYYSKKSVLPDKEGSRFYDLYEYNLSTKIERRITKGSRAFSPAYSKRDSSIFYISTNDGTQNIYKINLKSRNAEKITSYKDHEILSGLNYDSTKHQLTYDLVSNHFKDIHFISLTDSTQGKLLNSDLWDQRQVVYSDDALLYSDDRSGIFNLYYISKNKQGYLTNVLGGAFMPSISRVGNIIYSLFEGGKYKIALLDSLDIIDDENIGYSSTYFNRNKNLNKPISGKSDLKTTPYEDHFPPMFFMPRATYDYGTFKPGVYFYSSEILNKVSLLGGASSNKIKDLDLYFIMEYKHLFPTLFFEAYYMTRNSEDRTNYSVYKFDNNLQFRLVEFKGGLKLPFYGTELEVFTNWSQYRASIKQEILGKPNLRAGYGYDYYRGKKLGLKWSLVQLKRRVDQNINPVGLKINAALTNEWNEFIDGIDLSDSGTLTSSFKNHNLTRIELNGRYSRELPGASRSTISIGSQIGFLNEASVDSFFHFFSGGAPGIKGYPYYSMQGTEFAIIDVGLRVPIFREKHIPLSVFTLQNSTIGLIYQTGDAWNRNYSSVNFKKSAGIELRASGLSFYNYPTAIGIECHRGLDAFTMDIGTGESFDYGLENRFYFNILFGF